MKQTRKSEEITATPPRTRGSRKGGEGAAASAVTPGESGRKQGDAKRHTSKSTVRGLMERYLQSGQLSGRTKQPTGGAGQEGAKEDAKEAGGQGQAGEDGKVAPFAVDFGNVGSKVQAKKQKSAARKKQIEEHAKKTLAAANAQAAKERIGAKKQSVFTKAKEKRIDFVSKQKEKMTWKHKLIVEFNVTVPHTQKGAKNAFDQKWGGGMKFIRAELQKDFVVLPLTGSTTSDLKPIASGEDLPEYEVSLRRYLHIPNTNAFADVKKGQTRKIKGSCWVAMNDDAVGTPLETMWASVQGDLRTLKCQMWIKPNQNIDTAQDVVFLGVPISVGTTKVKQIVDAVLKPLEKELIVENPSQFPKSRHQKEQWLDYALDTGYPYGLPWEEPEPGKENEPREPNGRMAYIFQIKREDQPRLLALLEEAKYRHLWKKHFGEPACTTKMVSQWDQDEEKRALYIDMVTTHGSVMLSTGAATIRGLINAEKVFTLRRKDDEGNDLAPIKKSIRHVLMYDKIEGEPVWTFIIKGDDGAYKGYFPSVAEPIKQYVQEFVSCPAAQIFWFLLSRG